jgi:hypothetical protein
MKKNSRDRTARQLRAEREKRVMDAIHLKVPDRVPIICGMGFFPARYAGIPFSAAYYDYNAWYNAYRKTLLQVGTVQQVKDYCKRLIDTVGEGGGFILSPRSSTDEVKPENLKTMITFTQAYGVYR